MQRPRMMRRMAAAAMIVLLLAPAPSSGQQGVVAASLVDAVIAPNVLLRDGRSVEVMDFRLEVAGSGRCDQAGRGRAVGWLIDADHDATTGATSGIAEDLGAEADLRFVCDAEAGSWRGPLGTLDVTGHGSSAVLSIVVDVGDLPSTDFAYAAYVDDGLAFARLPGTGSRWTVTTMARRTDGVAVSVVTRDLVASSFAQGQTSGISRTFRVRDCVIEIFRIVTPPVSDEERAAAEADIERVRATILRALQGSADMRTKFFDACSTQGGRLEFIIYRDDPDVLAGSRAGNRVNVDLGDVDRFAQASEGAEADVATVAENFLLTLLAHEIDHARTPRHDGDPSTPADNPAPEDDHSDPTGDAALTERGKPVDDENAVNEDLGTGIYRPVYAASAFPVRWLWQVDGRDVIVDPERINGDQLPDEDEDAEADRLGGPSPGAPTGLPGRPCEEGEPPDGCYVPRPPPAPAEGDDRDGDGVRDALEGALGSRSDDASAVPEHWALAGTCDDDGDGDGDGFVDATDATCRAPTPFDPFSGAVSTDAHRADRGGLPPATDVVTVTGTLSLDTDHDGEVDEEAPVEGLVVWQRVRGGGPARVLRPVALELAGTSEAIGSFTLVEATGPTDGVLAAEDAMLPADLTLVVAADVRTADGTHPADLPLVLTTRVEAWPPVGATSEVDGLGAIGEGEAPLVTVMGGTVTIGEGPGSVDTAPEIAARFDDGDPAALAAAAALQAFPDGVPTVLLARTEEFADALAGTALAGLHDAPILQTPGDTLAPAAADALEVLGAEEVILLGGPAAISPAVAEELAGRGFSVARIGGRTRLETMSLIADRLVGAVGTADDGVDRVPTAILATAEVFADALSAGAAAWQGGYPVVLTAQPALSAEAEAVVTDPELGIRQVVVTGGEAAVGPAVTDRLAELGLEVLRLAGAERTETAVRIGHFFAVQHASTRASLVVARADRFNEALALAPLAGRLGVPLYLVGATPGVPLTRVLDRYCGVITDVTSAGVADAVVDDLVRSSTC